MLQPYVPFLLLLGLVAANALAFVVVSHLVMRRRLTRVKGEPYESGMPPLGMAQQRFSVKFYLVAVLFIVFDIEAVFLIPWAAIYFADPAGAGGPGMGFLLLEMLLFLFILGVGYVYVWKRGALQWE